MFELLEYTSGAPEPKPSLTALVWWLWEVCSPVGVIVLVMVVLWLFGVIVLV